MRLIALHGFLGSSKDFTPLINELHAEDQWIPSLFGDDKRFLSKDFRQWTEMALAYIEERFRDEPVTLVGYSLGGRLALHLVMAKPELFDQVVLLSTHPGIFDSRQVEARRQWEREWTESFATLPMDQAISKWLAQSLFSQDEEREIESDHFDRKTLIRAFENFSNTKHLFTPKDLQTLRKKLTWAFGELDLKFLKIKEELEELRASQDQFVVVPEAGHRLIARKDLTWLYPFFSR